MIHTKIPFPELNISQQDIFKELGYGNAIPDASVADMVSKLIEQLDKTVVSEYAFKIYEGKIFEKALEVDSRVVLDVGPVIAPLMLGAGSFAIFVATAGKAFEEYMHQVKREDDILQTFLLDAIGTCTVEKAGDYMEERLNAEIGPLQHTHRFSPGYCNWLLTGQHRLFSLLGQDPCGITLSDVCLMNPIKSISGVIGIGPQVKRKQYGCQFCELETCYKRNQKKQQYEEHA